MRKPLLAISGKRFSGKDTLAALLVERARDRDITLQTFSFASESKRMFVEREAARGVTVDLQRLLTDRAYKELWRPLLTQFTVDSIGADPSVFCRAVAARIEAASDPCLVTDVRLELEVQLLRARFDLHLVRIVRSDSGRGRCGWVRSASVDEHHTETELDDPKWWDEVVTNDDTLEELGERAEALVRAFIPSPR